MHSEQPIDLIFTDMTLGEEQEAGLQIGRFGSRKTAMTEELGTNSWSSPSCFAAKSIVVKVTPVILLPGRLRSNPETRDIPV